MPIPLILGAAGIAGGLSLTGSMLSSAFNAQQASKNRAFQREMSNTAHQREVEDLRKAGLNPILSANHGGSSSPPGSAAQAANQNVVGDSLQGARAAAENKVMNAQAYQATSAGALSEAQTNDINQTQSSRINNLIAENARLLEVGKLTTEQKREVIQHIELLKAQKRLTDAQTLSSAADSEKKQVQGKLWSIPNKIMEGMDKTRPKNPPGSKKREQETFNWKTIQKVWGQ